MHEELLERQKLPAARRAARDIWKRRYREINEWERHLSDNGFRDRQALPQPLEGGAATALRPADRRPRPQLEVLATRRDEREHWDGYQHAFSEMLSHTSTEWAPWYVIPADHKWFARAVAAAAIAGALVELGPRYPTVDPETRREFAELRAALEAEAPSAGPPAETD